MKGAAGACRRCAPPPPAPLGSSPLAAGPLNAAGKPIEDPSTWSQEFDEDTEFVDAAEQLGLDGDLVVQVQASLHEIDGGYPDLDTDGV